MSLIVTLALISAWGPISNNSSFLTKLQVKDAQQHQGDTSEKDLGVCDYRLPIAHTDYFPDAQHEYRHDHRQSKARQFDFSGGIEKFEHMISENEKRVGECMSHSATEPVSEIADQPLRSRSFVVDD